MALITQKRKERLKREERIYRKYMRELSKGSQKTAAQSKIMKEEGIGAVSTFYAIIARVNNRRNDQ